MVLNLDMPFYSVICELGNCYYTPEIDLEEMSLARIIGDVRDGQFEKVRAVMEFNPVEGWCNDFTGDVLSAAFPEKEEPPDTDWSDYRDERIDPRRAGLTAVVAA
ncbi:MAG: hypothetical protein Tsb0019_29240 [Roseibium sp.]